MSNLLVQANRFAERGLGLHTLVVGGGLLGALVLNWQWDKPAIFTLAGFFAGLTSHGIVHIVFPGVDRRVHSAAMSGLVGTGLAIDALVHRSWIVAGFACGALLWAWWQSRVFADARVRWR